MSLHKHCCAPVDIRVTKGAETRQECQVAMPTSARFGQKMAVPIPAKGESVFQTCACDRFLTRSKRLLGVVAHLRPCSHALLRHGRMLPSSLLATRWWPLCFPSFVHALSDLRLIHATTFMAQVKTTSIHSPYFINLVAEPMEPIHAELLRLANQLEAVRGQVLTECNALRDIFARTTTAMSGSQHDQRLNHKEAGRHVSEQFGGSRLYYGDFAFWMEGHAAVLSRDGQGGALLREVAKLEKLEDETIKVLGMSNWDVQQLGAAMAAARTTRTRGEVETLVRRILSVSPGDGLQAWHAGTQWFKPRSVVEQAASMVRLISPERIKNVNELQVVVVQWELTFVHHESQFSEVVADSVKTAAMRAMLPKDILERFLDDFSIMKNFEIVCLHM